MKQEYKIYREILSGKTQKSPILRNKWHVLIWQLVDDPSFFSTKEWIRDMGVAKKLWPLYPNLEFWSQINLDWYPNSLHYFLSGKGKKTIYKKINEFKLNSTIDLTLPEPTKYDQTAVFKRQKKALIEVDPKTFLSNGKKTK